MTGLFNLFLRPALFTLDAEAAHGLSVAGLKLGAVLFSHTSKDACLRVQAAGLDFPNPLGMAAGFDKNGEVPDALLALGFGFAEAGTVTPLPQEGNPKPRVFRLPAEGGVINRLGFNNEGHDAVFARLSGRTHRAGIVGVNIGANKTSADRIADYEIGVRRFAPIASYLTINISSPNTPGLRNLQNREALEELLIRVMAARPQAESGKGPVPVFLKISPDNSDAELEDIAGSVLAHKLDGIILTNTTLSRSGLSDSRTAAESGGLSGRPLFERSTITLARMRKLVGKDLTLIGAGGVDSSTSAIEKIRAGADLVQLYTGMVYQGPGLAGTILNGMVRHCRSAGLASISQLRDSSVEEWAGKAFV